jgi:hypothetical protein
MTPGVVDRVVGAGCDGCYRDHLWSLGGLLMEAWESRCCCGKHIGFTFWTELSVGILLR